MHPFNNAHRRQVVRGITGSNTAKPSQARNNCVALFQDGSECKRCTPEPRHDFCQPHHHEYVELYMQYKDAEKDYKQLAEPKEGLSPEGKRDKIAWGKKTLDLRNQVNRRFYSQNANNRGHIRWILKLENEIGVLEGSLKLDKDHRMSTPEHTKPNNSESGNERRVYQSLLSPEIPMSTLNHLPKDHPTKVLKQTVQMFSRTFLARLYKIAPSLDDSGTVLVEPDCDARREPDKGDHVIRFVFRELLLWKADAETLSRATKAESIDIFLGTCSPSELEDYIKFFESLGREDTLHFLRDAVCDYLLPPSASTTIILGGAVATENTQRSMTIEGWDILYSYFWNIVGWYNVEQFCVRFEDMSLIKRLIALHRYSGTEDGEPTWLNKDNDVSQECSIALVQGFIAVTKGYLDFPETPITTKDGIMTERCCRCYLTGRMAKNEPLAKTLIAELVNRIARYIVIVYDMESCEYDSRNIISQSDELEEMPWITRIRSVADGQTLEGSSWTTELSLKDILTDLEFIQRLRASDMIKDYYEFIIIDRHSGNAFPIIEDVADALIQLAGDPPVKNIIKDAIQRCIPADQQQQWLQTISLEASALLDLNVPNIHYEGSRVRSWSVLDNDPAFVRRNQKRSKSDRRITSKIVAEMESHGLITTLKKFQPSHTCPTVRRGADGLEDLYFDYNPGSPNHDAIRRSLLMSPEISLSPESLCKFAETFKAANPDAVFAKGNLRVHYCSWPIPVMRRIPTFRTIEGHLYEWKVLPFDWPLSSRVWQCHIHYEMNKKLPFVYFVQTTFVVCAKNPEAAEGNLQVLVAAAAKHNWKLSAPQPSLWTNDLNNLDLQTLWEGIQPATYIHID